MPKMFTTVLLYVLANGVGLLIAALLLPGFNLDFIGFIIATLLLSIVEAVAGPLIAQASSKNLPTLQGGVALITTFVGLFVTNLIVSRMQITGISTWVIATVLVWLGAMIATLVLPKVLEMATKKTGTTGK